MSSDSTQLGLEENIEGALAYLLLFVSGIVLYLVEEDNQFVRFHAAQSTILFGGLAVVRLILGIFSFGAAIGLSFIGFIFSGLFMLFNLLLVLVTFILWLVLMLKAYSGEKYKLPMVGDLAEDFVE